jgi:3-phenylpropionate/cinnamic acid dioxygenase small subunit
MNDRQALPAIARGVPNIDVRPFENFLLHEARLLDERRFREWMALFTEDGTYWVPAVPDQSSPFNQVSLFFDDRDLMNTRISRLEHPRMHIQSPASRTVHLINNVTVEQVDADRATYEVSSVVVMYESRADEQRTFAGRQTHTLQIEADQFRIQQKRVNLINCDTSFGPIAVPI